MRRIIKHILPLLMTMLIIASTIVPAFAADSTVTFKGQDEGFEFLPGSEYTETDLFDNFKGVMPGDSLTEEITVTNASDDSDYIKLYIRAEAYDEETNPLSTGVAAAGETIATMSEFLSQLSMTVWNGDTDGEPIYEASPDELDGFAENVYLGTIRKDETVTLNVKLDVPLNLGDKYQNRVGEVTWVFVAELFDDPTPPPTDNTVLTARKIWVDDGDSRPDSIKVNLLRDGKYYAETELNEDNHWTYTWSKLEDSNKWTVEEAEVPEGYTVSYKIEGNITTIINTADKTPVEPGPDIPVPPVEPVSLSVKKAWSGDEENVENRPESVKVTLYNGTEAVESVVLGKWNEWSFTWDDLAADGDWKVLEVDIPKGYAPTYESKDGLVTITNVSTLIQTGQVKWPIPVLMGAGLVMVIFGGVVITRKRKRENV